MKHFKHNFRGYGVHPSSCNVYVHTEDDQHYVLFENIGEGTSVTNASEQLASEITKSLALDPEKCRFFETYREFDYDSFDEITYQWKDGVAHYPNWKPCENESVINMFIKYMKQFG